MKSQHLRAPLPPFFCVCANFSGEEKASNTSHLADRTNLIWEFSNHLKMYKKKDFFMATMQLPPRWFNFTTASPAVTHNCIHILRMSLSPFSSSFLPPPPPPQETATNPGEGNKSKSSFCSSSSSSSSFAERREREGGGGWI